MKRALLVVLVVVLLGWGAAIVWTVLDVPG